MELRVATFNIKHGETAGGEVDIELTARVCRRLDVDVLGLQEVDRNLERTERANTPAAIAAECGMTYAFGPAIAVRGGEYGNALLARGVLTDVEVLDLPRPSGKEARAALLATATVRGLSVTIAVTHLSVPPEDSAPQLQALVDALGARARPQVLLGDLNLPPDALAALEAGGYAIAGGGPTWPAKAPRRRIDHVAALGLEIVSVEIPETPSSDHRPLVAVVGREAAPDDPTTRSPVNLT